MVVARSVKSVQQSVCQYEAAQLYISLITGKNCCFEFCLPGRMERGHETAHPDNFVVFYV